MGETTIGTGSGINVAQNNGGNAPRLCINRQQENVLRSFDEIVGSLSCNENLDIVFQVSMFFYQDISAGGTSMVDIIHVARPTDLGNFDMYSGIFFVKKRQCFDVQVPDKEQK